MTAPSYCGPERTVTCDNCGHAMLAHDWPREEDNQRKSHCTKCKRLTTKTEWKGVIPAKYR